MIEVVLLSIPSGAVGERNIRRFRDAYNSQKHGAKSRGIPWLLSFREWLNWWGEDIHRRGVGHDNLCMQRIGDVGPYALWNIRKGYPKQNSITRGKGTRHKNSLRWAAEAARQAMESPSDLHEPDETEPSEFWFRNIWNEI